jgi:hypothetical protein
MLERRRCCGDPPLPHLHVRPSWSSSWVRAEPHCRAQPRSAPRCRPPPHVPQATTMRRAAHCEPQHMCPCLPTLVGEEKEGQRCCCTPPISLDVAFFDGLSLRWHHGTQVERLNGRPDLAKKAVPAERLTELVLFDPKRAKR